MLMDERIDVGLSGKVRGAVGRRASPAPCAVGNVFVNPRFVANRAAVMV